VGEVVEVVEAVADYLRCKLWILIFWYLRFLVVGCWLLVLVFCFFSHLTGVRNYWSELCASKSIGVVPHVIPHSARNGQIGGPL
jgi:hypothetical protein